METKKEGFPAAFWVCACTEIFERLAYYCNFCNLCISLLCVVFYYMAYIIRRL